MKRVQVNNNGNTRSDLIDEINEARQAVSDATLAMSKMTLHGRNYQTLPNHRDVLQEDIKEMQENLQKLEQVSDYLLECGIHITSQS